MQQDHHQGGLKPSNPLDDMRKAFNLALFASFILAVPVQVCFRRIGSHGSKYAASYHFLLGLLWIVVFGALCPAGEQYLFLGFAGFCTAGLILHALLRKKGNHSQYVGDSICGGGKHAMTVFEPVLAFGAALVAAYFSLGLAALIAISGIASSFFH